MGEIIIEYFSSGDVISSTRVGVRMTFYGSGCHVVCTTCRTRHENEALCYQALAILMQVDVAALTSCPRIIK